MPSLPHRDTVAGWLFAAAAYAMVVWHHAFSSLYHARSWSLLLFPRHLAAQYFFMGAFTLAVLPAAGLLVTTGWGVAHRRNWARWTGLFPCLYLLPGFPALTAAGAAGIYYLWTRPRYEARELSGPEFWTPSRQSGWMLAASIFGWFLAHTAYNALQARALDAGVLSEPAAPGLPAFLMIMLAQVAIHECGHALAAVCAGFRMRVLAVGPLVFRTQPSPWKLSFDWKGLLLLGGFTGSVPVNVHRFRVRQCIVVGAGPATSLAAAALLLAMAPRLCAPLWPVATMSALMGFYIGFVNLLPFGYCDGSMLYHMLLRTRRGDELIDLILTGANLRPRHTALREYTEFVSAHAAALQQLLHSSTAGPGEVARAYIALGSYEMAAQELRAAEKHVRQGLQFLPEGTAPELAAAGWECLQIVRADRGDYAGADAAYKQALAIQPRVTQHLQARNWAAALLMLDSSESSPLALALRAEAWLHTGAADAGLAAAEQAAAEFRARGGLEAFHHLGLLGRTLWQAGYTELAAARLTECIQLLEAGSAFRLAASFRLMLADVFAGDGHFARAACVLPKLQDVPVDVRGEYHRIRGHIRQAGGYLVAAIQDFRASVASGRHPAEAQADLASVLAEAGELDEAEALAAEGRNAAAHIALALVAQKQHLDPTPHIDAAMRLWDEDPRLLPAERERERRSAERCLERCGIADPFAVAALT